MDIAEAAGLADRGSRGAWGKMKDYSAPEIRDLGTVASKTQTGLTNPGTDGKAGSRPSQGQ